MYYFQKHNSEMKPQKAEMAKTFRLGVKLKQCLKQKGGLYILDILPVEEQGFRVPFKFAFLVSFLIYCQGPGFSIVLTWYISFAHPWKIK